LINNDLISIITPFKNSSKYIEDCINSILKQTIKNWELIIVDDYSTDNSFDIVKRMSLKDDRIKLYKNNGNNGIIETLRIGLNKSVGNYITRMDSDDLMITIKLEELYLNLKEKGKGFVSTSCVKYFSKIGIGKGYKNYEDWLNELMINKSNFKDIYKECVIPSPNWMIHREDLMNSDAFNSNIYPEDYDLVFRFYKNNIKIVSSVKKLHLWRDYSNRTSRVDSNYADNHFLDLKIKYFLELNYDNRKELVIWGAGKKGKLLAKKLSEQNIRYSWVCNNPNKIGKQIYNNQILNVDYLNRLNNFQSVITVASKDSQKLIKDFFSSKNLICMKDYYFFC
jgi:glycosyltransferase involved in cell wall biosynthesis